MRLGVRSVDELARNEAVGNFLCELVGLGNSTLHALCALGEHELRAIRLHKLAALNAHGLGHDDDYAIASCGGDGCKADAGVAAGGLNDDGVGVQQTLRLCVVDHRLCNSVLNGACRVKILKLCEDLGLEAELLFNVGELKQGSGTNKPIGGSVYFRHDIISF